MKKTIHYLCFSVNEDSKDKLHYFPSAQPKIRYVIDTIKKAGFNVNVVSSCSIKNNGFFKGHCCKVDNFENNIYFNSFKTSINIIDKLSVILSWTQIILYCLFRIKKQDKIIIYHSLYYLRPINMLKKIKKVQFILEVEELYSCLNIDNRRFYNSEIDFINSASSYLLVNDLIDEKINRGKKPAIISYGNYSVPNELSNKNFQYKNYVNVVYAGVIENTRKAAFIAVDSAYYLNSNYRIHILGFGDKKDIEELKKKIKEVNTKCNEERVIFHGEMLGNDYYGFLQSCDIALSCHTYDKDMQDSADYTFPSKVITYLANGLRVISSNVRCVKKSKLGNSIIFYKNNFPEEIAKYILSINIDDNYDSKRLIKELDKKFSYEIKLLLEN